MLWIKKKIPDVIKNPFKRLYGILLSNFATLVRKNKDEKRGIIIFSFPRSGSTWLMDLISEGGSGCSVFEPFNSVEDQFFRPYLRCYLIQPSLANKVFFYKVSAILKGIYFTRWSSNYTSLKKIVNSKRAVVKFIRANYMLGWFNNNFPANKKIILFRHPLAVVRSMKRSAGEWHELSKEKLTRKSQMFFGDKYDKIIDECKTLPDLLLISWCLEAKAILNDYKEGENLIVYYEEIFKDPRKTLIEIFYYLEIEFNEEILKKVSIPSKTTNKDASIFSLNPLSKWKEDFMPEELNRMAKIYMVFQVPFYKEEMNRLFKTIET